MLIEKQEKEKKSSPTRVESSPRHVCGAASQHVSPRPRRSPSPDCYRRRSPAARAAPAEVGAVGGAASVCDSTLGVRLPAGSGKPKSPVSPRRSRRTREPNDDSTNLAPYQFSGTLSVGMDRISESVCLFVRSITKTNGFNVFKLWYREWSWDILEVTWFWGWKIKGQG